MKAFWEWMKEKHGAKKFDNDWTIKDQWDSNIMPTKQMLIGYMIEYLRYRKCCNREDTIHFELYGVDEIYDNLKQKIEGLK